MTSLRVLAPGKVNLCLFLGGVREDGRHELVTVFESVSLADQLLVSRAEHDHVICPGVNGPNLVTNALERLRGVGWDAPPVRVEIEKRIPVAAGMGGGSADAAAVLRAASELSPLPSAVLAKLAAELGADVPSQLWPGLSLGTGAGEVVEPLAPLAPHALVIVPSDGALATAEVYREADRLGLDRPGAELAVARQQLSIALRSGAMFPAHLLVNDLTSAAQSLCPSIAGVLDAVGRAGADIGIMCGSGPTVAGLFWGSDAEERAAEAASSLQSPYRGAVSAVPVRADHGNPRIA